MIMYNILKAFPRPGEIDQNHVDKKDSRGKGLQYEDSNKHNFCPASVWSYMNDCLIMYEWVWMYHYADMIMYDNEWLCTNDSIWIRLNDFCEQDWRGTYKCMNDSAWRIMYMMMDNMVQYSVIMYDTVWVCMTQ